MMKKILVSVLGLMIILLILGNVSSAYFNLCLKDGERVRFSRCNSLMKDQTCHSSLFCSYCVYIGKTGAYCPAPINKCNAIGGGCNYLSGDGGGGGGGLDLEPPNITECVSPDEGVVYSSKRVYIRASSNKLTDWYYQDMNEKRPKWKKMCKQKRSCVKKVSFDEGANTVKIKAVAKNGLYDEKEINFVVDSKKPKIYKTNPKKGFANGLFEVDFREENVKSLMLYYGSESKEINVSDECNDNGKKSYCSTEVDISGYSGKKISYWFVLKDVANSEDSSKKITLNVDSEDPVLNNPSNFWSQGQNKYNKYIFFNMEISENNLQGVMYIDRNNRSPKWKKICSKLKNGKCERKVKFGKGHHEVEVMILDEAGNDFTVPDKLSFDVV